MATVIDRPGAKSEVRYVRMSASKARVVLGLVRGKKVSEALNTLYLSDRKAVRAVEKCLKSAVANAEHNEEIPAEELYVAECYADAGPTIKRFRPRARGRASKIQKQTCHIVVKVCRYSDEELEALRAAAEKRSKTSKSAGKKKTSRADRVAKSKAVEEPAEAETEATDEVAAEAVEEAAAEVTEAAEVETEEVAEAVEADAAEVVAEEEVTEEAATDGDAEDKEGTE